MPHRHAAGHLPVPIAISPFDESDHKTKTIRVVIETAHGGRNKMAYDEDLGIFRLKKVLPEGMSFPCDFGFVPSTRGGDGDPVDALVLMDEASTTGCLIVCRLIGVLLGVQGPKKKRERNDRLIAVAIPSYTHSDINHVDDLNRNLLSEIEKFFVNYHAEYGEKYRVVGCKGPRAAWRLVKDGARIWKREKKRNGG